MCTNHFVMLSFINQLVAASYRLKKSFKYFTVEVLVMEGKDHFKQSSLRVIKRVITILIYVNLSVIWILNWSCMRSSTDYRTSSEIINFNLWLWGYGITRKLLTMLVEVENLVAPEMMSQIESPMAIGNFDQCHIEPNSMFDQNLWCPDWYVDFFVVWDLRILIKLVDHLYVRVISSKEGEIKMMILHVYLGLYNFELLDAQNFPFSFNVIKWVKRISWCYRIIFSFWWSIVIIIYRK